MTNKRFLIKNSVVYIYLSKWAFAKTGKNTIDKKGGPVKL